MEIAVSEYSYYQYTEQGKLPQYETIDVAHKMGFKTMEFTMLDGETLEEQKELAKKIRKHTDELGIEIVAYAVGADLFCEGEAAEKEIERVCGQLDIAKILGAKLMRHDVVYKFGKEGKARSFDLMLPVLAENTRRITEYGASIGIKTCTENHGYIVQDPDRLEKLFNAVNHENYGLLIDIGNFSCGDLDFADSVAKLANLAVHVHAKDVRCFNEPVEGGFPTRGGQFMEGAVVGEGEVPVKRCIRILKRAGFDGVITIEYEAKEDCMTGVARSFDNLKKYIDEVENEG